MIMDKVFQTTVTTDLAATLGTASTARAWLTEAAQNGPDELSTQQSLLAVTVALETQLPGAALPGKRGQIERALAHGKWQKAYDAAMELPLGGSAALARTLLVADTLREAGAPEASLDILARSLDAYSRTPELYSLLADVLTMLGRAEDAAAAHTLLREYAPTAQLVAA
jgi:hypothetical protein